MSFNIDTNEAVFECWLLTHRSVYHYAFKVLLCLPNTLLWVDSDPCSIHMVVLPTLCENPEDAGGFAPVTNLCSVISTGQRLPLKALTSTLLGLTLSWNLLKNMKRRTDTCRPHLISVQILHSIDSCLLYLTAYISKRNWWREMLWNGDVNHCCLC